MVPRPVVAVLFLYPIKEASEKRRAEEAERIRTEGGCPPPLARLNCVEAALTALRGDGSAGQTVSDNVFYMKQFVGNACGTIGLLHAACNAVDVAKPGRRPHACGRGVGAVPPRPHPPLPPPPAQWRAPSLTSSSPTARARTRWRWAGTWRTAARCDGRARTKPARAAAAADAS